MFDTGSPLTFFFDNVSEYSIDGKNYSVRQNPMAAMLAQFKFKIEEMIGVSIDAFIGIDALKNSEVGISFIERCLEVK